MEARAEWRFARVAPRKARTVCDLLRRQPLGKVYEMLSVVPRRASRQWLKVIDSAVANLKNAVGKENWDPDNVFIKEIKADVGPVWKRWMPRAMGRATPIQKYTSHLTVVVAEKE